MRLAAAFIVRRLSTVLPGPVLTRHAGWPGGPDAAVARKRMQGHGMGTTGEGMGLLDAIDASEDPKTNQRMQHVVVPPDARAYQAYPWHYRAKRHTRDSCPSNLLQRAKSQTPRAPPATLPWTWRPACLPRGRSTRVLVCVHRDIGTGTRRAHSDRDYVSDELARQSE